MCRSVPQIPAARTASSTCPGSGLGWGSSRSATLPSPRAVFTTAGMVVMLAPPSSHRVQWRILLHVEGCCLFLQKAQQCITLCGERGGIALRQWVKRRDGECGRQFLALHAPDPRDRYVHEDRGRDTAILGPQDEVAMLVPKHARPVGMGEQQVVELRQKPRWRRSVLRRPRRTGQIEQRPSALVAKQG